VTEGKFHIYPVRTIDEGIEILTGVPAGAPDADGTYPEDSVHGRVVARLEEIAENLKGKDDKKDEEDEKEGSPDGPTLEAGLEDNPVPPGSAEGEEEGDQTQEG
jgi:hypothetical protein